MSAHAFTDARVSSIEAIHALTVDYLKAGVTEFRETTTASHGNAEYVVDEGTYVLTEASRCSQ